MNFDEVVIDLAQATPVNVLSATEQMQYADPTDSVEKVEVLRVSNPAWEVTPHSLDTPRQSVYQIKHHGKVVGRLSVHHEIGEVSKTLHEGEDVKVTLRISRINYNRRRRV
jgi:hypothetical protein